MPTGWGHGLALAFAQLAFIPFGQQGPDLLQYLRPWLVAVADGHAQRECSGFVPLSVTGIPVSDALPQALHLYQP
jgi:hypothetical protein